MTFELPPEQKKKQLQDIAEHLESSIEKVQSIDEEFAKERISLLQDKVRELKKLKNERYSGVSIMDVSDQEKKDFVLEMKDITNFKHEINELNRLLEKGEGFVVDDLLEKLFQTKKEIDSLDNVNN